MKSLRQWLTRLEEHDRMMFRTRNETGVDVTAPHKLRRYYQQACEQKRPLEVACVLGLHGVDLMSSVATASEDVDEYEIMGALRREPVELVKCETMISSMTRWCIGR